MPIMLALQLRNGLLLLPYRLTIRKASQPACAVYFHASCRLREAEKAPDSKLTPARESHVDNKVAIGVKGKILFLIWLYI